MPGSFTSIAAQISWSSHEYPQSESVGDSEHVRYRVNGKDVLLLLFVECEEENSWTGEVSQFAFCQEAAVDET